MAAQVGGLRPGQCGEAATWAPASVWAGISPHSQCPSPEPPPVPQSSPFSVTPKIPRKAEPSEQFPLWSVQEPEHVHDRHGHLPPQSASFIFRLSSPFLQLLPSDSWWSSLFHSNTKHQAGETPGPWGQPVTLASQARGAPGPHPCPPLRSTHVSPDGTALGRWCPCLSQPPVTILCPAARAGS